MNKFVRTKSPTESKFFKKIEQLYTGCTPVVHLYCGFLCGVRWRHNRAPHSEPRFGVNFVPVWGRIASLIMHRFGRCFRRLLEYHYALCNAKIFFQQLYTAWIVVVHLYCGFSLWRQMEQKQSAKFTAAFFGQFCTSLRKHSVASYASIWKLFSTSVTGPHALWNALKISQIHL